MSIDLGSGTFFITDMKTGKTYQMENSVCEIEQAFCADAIPKTSVSLEGEFTGTAKISTIAFLKILGFARASNNWLKMNGGILQRKTKRKGIRCKR